MTIAGVAYANMADDNRLTRRRVLGGIGTIGAAGALGAGTWAAYSDTETKRLATRRARSI